MTPILPLDHPALVMTVGSRPQPVAEVMPCDDRAVAAAAGRIRRAIGMRIQLWRMERGWTLDVLAGHVGVSASTVSLWEHAKRTPSLENLVGLSALMGVAPGELLADEERPAPVREAV